MKLYVQYMAQLRTAIGRSEDEVELPDGSSLAQLLVCLAARGGRDVEPHLITETGKTRPSLLVVVNETAVSARHAATTVLQPGDKVTLLPPIAGG